MTLDEIEAAGAERVPDMAESSEDEAMAVDEVDAEEEGESSKGQASAAAAPEEEEARVPKTKRAPIGMTSAEWQIHRLTHLPYNPACRCCVAGRKRDDQHRRVGPLQAEAALDTEGGASICADYFFPS